MTGMIAYYNEEKGFGFIRQDDDPRRGSNIFFHITDFNGNPETDMKVKYDIVKSNKGFQATNVSEAL